MMLYCLLCSGTDDMGVAAGLVGQDPWCFVVGAPTTPQRTMCDKPSFWAQQLSACCCGWCRRCLAMRGTEHRVSPDLVTDVCICGGVMFVTAMAMLFCPSIAKGRGGTAHPEGSKGMHAGEPRGRRAWPRLAWGKE